MATPKEIRSSAAVFDKITILRNHPVFRQFSPSIIEKVASYMTRRTVSRGTTIFSRGEAGTGLFGVIAGRVKISVLSLDGKELVINIINPGEIFGEIALLDGGSRTADATALSDCQLIVLERRDFIPLLRGQPDMALKFVEILCMRLRKTSDHLEDTVFLGLPSRLAKALLQLTRNSEKSKVGSRISITQRDIGQIIGTSRESTNKQLRAWAERGWVRLQRGAVIVLKPDLLAQVAAEDTQADS